MGHLFSFEIAKQNRRSGILEWEGKLFHACSKIRNQNGCKRETVECSTRIAFKWGTGFICVALTGVFESISVTMLH